MSGSWLAWGGAAAALGVLAASWQHVKSAWATVRSWVIVTCEVEGSLGNAVTLYLHDHFRTTRFGVRAFFGTCMYIQPLRRVALFAMEVTSSGGRVFWRGWRWVRVSHQSEPPGTNYRTNMRDREIQLTYVRGLFDLDGLVLKAVDHYNEKWYRSGGRRHRVVHVTGMAGKPAVVSGQDGLPLANSSPEDDTRMVLGHRMVRWSPGELGRRNQSAGIGLADLALSAEADGAVTGIRRWLESETWYRGHGVPWRRGLLLHGPPGTGKTSLVRGLAVDLDLPVYVFDLATLFNDELRKRWNDMLAETPCLALFEDLDGVFEGREPLRDAKVTFDCVLNCLDGVEVADGVLTVITTNRIDTLDPAISMQRPGRVDAVIEMDVLDEAGRRKIARRVLGDVDVDQVVRVGDGMTGVQFQEVCVREALSRVG